MTFVNATTPMEQQIGSGNPIPAGLRAVTSPVYPPQSLLWRLRSFSNEVYSLQPSDHLVRLMGVLLGDAGGEQLRKRGLVSRLQTTLAGSSFLTLDAFWGALFSLNRISGESYPTNPATGLTLNPYSDSAMPAVWNGAHQADTYFRSRIFQFALGLSYGPSPVGMKKVSEAVLNCPVDLYETFQSAPANYTAVIVPHRVITLGEMFNLHNVLRVIKPADALVQITQGIGTINNTLTLAQAWADSSYWEVQANIVPGPTSLYSATSNQRPRYAYSAYQGESWELNSEITGVSSATWDYLNNVLATTDFEHFVWPDGSFSNFTPDLAIQPGWQLELGRIANSGITTANPMNNQGSVSSVLMDGMSMTSLSTLIQTSAQPAQAQRNHYWSTPPRLGTDNTQDVLSLTFKQPHLVNHFSFQVANFPHTASLYVQDPPSGNWIQVYSYTISTCSPLIFGDSSQLLANHLHPQHSTPDAWVPMTVRMNPATVQNVQIRLQRFSGIGPNTATNTATAYSLGVANFAATYMLDDPQLLPVGQIGATIDTTTNVLGDQVTYSSYLEEPNTVINTANSQSTVTLSGGLFVGTTYTSITAQSAVTLARGSILILNHQQVTIPFAVNNSTTIPTASFTPNQTYNNGTVFGVTKSQWRCSPQPSASSVVNFYVDSRSNGSPQVVDKFYVEPTHIGVTANLYWTNQVPTPGVNGRAVSTPLPVTATSVTPGAVGLTMGATNSSVVVPSTAIMMGQDWWAGISFIPSTTLTSYTLMSFGGNTVSVSNNIVNFTSSKNDIVTLGTVVPQTVNNIVVGVVTPDATTDLGTNPNGTIYLGVNGATTTAVPAQVLTLTTPTLTVGATAANVGYTLTDFVLKGEAIQKATGQGYMTNAVAYCSKGTYRFQDQGLTQNAYVRFDPSLINSVTNVNGFVGGTPDFMAGLQWVPLVKDFVLTRGNMSFRPTLASFWKFEMTNLVAEPYAVYLPQIQAVSQTFGQNASTPGQGNSSYQGAIPVAQSAVQVQATGQPQFFNTTPIPSAEPDPRTISPTATLVADSPPVAQALANQFFNFGYTDIYQSPAMSVNDSGGTTSYISTSTNQVTQMAFFCGFYLIQAKRANPGAQVDPPVIWERFLDEQNYVF